MPARLLDVRRLRSVAVTVAFVTLASCSSVKDAVVLDKPPPRVAVKGYQLELAYGREPAAETAPAVSSVVDTLETLLAPAFDDFFEFADSDRSVMPRRSFAAPTEPCPPPTPSTVAERPITPDVKVAAEAGSYLWQNSGTLDLGGILKTSLAGLSTRTVSNVRDVASTGTGVVPPSGGVDPTRRATLYDVDSSAGLLRFTHSFRVEPGQGIFLSSLKTISGNGTSTFNPAVPVKIFPLPAVENATVADVGVDPITGQALVVQGQITKKDRIEGCDELVDGWSVDGTWTFLRAGQLPSAWNYDYTVATQHGGLIVADRLQATEVIAGLAFTIDASSAFGTVKPKKAGGS